MKCVERGDVSKNVNTFCGGNDRDLVRGSRGLLLTECVVWGVVEKNVIMFCLGNLSFFVLRISRGFLARLFLL